MAGSQTTSHYLIALPLMAAATCLPWAAHAGRDAVVSPQSAAPRVAYIQKVDPGFEVRIMDVTTGQIHDLLHLINPPGPLSVARHGQVLLVFGDSALHVLDLQSQKQEEISPLPEPVLAKGFLNATPENAGYLQDGSLAVVMRSDDKTSDMMFHLFQRTADGWKALETSEACGYYRECPPNYGFKHALVTHGTDGGGPAPILGKGIEQNPFFLSRSDRPPTADTDHETDDDVEGYAIVFDFGTSRSTLVYETQPDPDSGPDYMSSLSLEVPGQEPRVLCEGQCGGEIMGRYLLTNQLIDLSNGKVLLTDGNDMFKRIMTIDWVY